MKKGVLEGKGIFIFGIIAVLFFSIMVNFFWDSFALGNYQIGRMDAQLGCIPMLSSFAGCGTKSILNVFLALTLIGLVVMMFWG